MRVTPLSLLSLGAGPYVLVYFATGPACASETRCKRAVRAAPESSRLRCTERITPEVVFYSMLVLQELFPQHDLTQALFALPGPGRRIAALSRQRQATPCGSFGRCGQRLVASMALARPMTRPAAAYQAEAHATGGNTKREEGKCTVPSARAPASGAYIRFAASDSHEYPKCSHNARHEGCNDKNATNESPHGDVFRFVDRRDRSAAHRNFNR
jgi:hypothetical protein